LPAETADDYVQVLSMDEGLAAALSRLESILARSRAAIVPLLHPGIDEAEVARLLAGVGLTPSAEVVTWFGWHDGAGTSGVSSVAVRFLPGGEFYDLRHLCDEYEMTRSVASDVAAMPMSVFDVEQLWPTHWFPLLRLFGKGLLAVDLAANEGSTSPVHIVWHDSDLDERADWESVGSFVETVIDRFEEGVYTIDDDGIVRGPTIDHPSR
jgi:cell wall assembly regulator SMI1